MSELVRGINIRIFFFILNETFTEIIYSGHEMTQSFSFKSRLTRIKDRTHLSSSTRNFKNKRNQEPEVN